MKSNLPCAVLALLLSVPAAGTVFAYEGQVRQLSVRSQKCFVDFQGEQVEIEIQYSGNLLTGRRLQVFDMQARSIDSGGLLKIDLFSPRDKYAPRGFLGRLGSRFGFPIMKEVSDRYAKNMSKLDLLKKDEVLVLEEGGDDSGDLVPVKGCDNMFLPRAFACFRPDGTLGGRFLRDTDADGVMNLFDKDPFFYQEDQRSIEDELEDRAEKEAKRELKKELRQKADQLRQRTQNMTKNTADQHARIDQELRKRHLGRYKNTRFSAEAASEKMPDTDVWRKGFRKTIKDVASSGGRKGFFAVLSSQPVMIIPVALATTFALRTIGSSSSGDRVGGQPFTGIDGGP